jgi:hypothetical protein
MPVAAISGVVVGAVVIIAAAAGGGYWTARAQRTKQLQGDGAVRSTGSMLCLPPLKPSAAVNPPPFRPVGAASHKKLIQAAPTASSVQSYPAPAALEAECEDVAPGASEHVLASHLCSLSDPKQAACAQSHLTAGLVQPPWMTRVSTAGGEQQQPFQAPSTGGREISTGRSQWNVPLVAAALVGVGSGDRVSGGGGSSTRWWWDQNKSKNSAAGRELSAARGGTVGTATSTTTRQSLQLATPGDPEGSRQDGGGMTAEPELLPPWPAGNAACAAKVTSGGTQLEAASSGSAASPGHGDTTQTPAARGSMAIPVHGQATPGSTTELEGGTAGPSGAGLSPALRVATAGEPVAANVAQLAVGNDLPQAGRRVERPQEGGQGQGQPEDVAGRPQVVDASPHEQVGGTALPVSAVAGMPIALFTPGGYQTDSAVPQVIITVTLHSLCFERLCITRRPQITLCRIRSLNVVSSLAWCLIACMTSRLVCLPCNPGLRKFLHHQKPTINTA